MFPFRWTVANLKSHFAIVVCALTVNGMLTANADASCGDWLADTTMSAEHGSGADFALFDTRLPHGGPMSPHEPPCHGPQCRRAPQHPVPPSPSRSLTLEEDRWCQTLSSAVSLSPPHSSWLVEQALILPAPLHSRLDRPPRG